MVMVRAFGDQQQQAEDEGQHLALLLACHFGEHICQDVGGVLVERQYRRYRLDALQALRKLGEGAYATVYKLGLKGKGVVGYTTVVVGIVVVKLPAVWYVRRYKCKATCGKLCLRITEYTFATSKNDVSELPRVLAVQWKLLTWLHSFVLKFVKIHIRSNVNSFLLY